MTLITPTRSLFTLGGNRTGSGLFALPKLGGIQAPLGSRGSLEDVGQTLFNPYTATETVGVNPADSSASSKPFSPLVIGLIGRRGRGKTLGMTMIAEIMRQKYARSRNPSSIASNYWMEFGRFYSPFIVDELVEFPDWAHDLYLCIDEIQTAVMSRRSMSKTNISVSSFLTMIRKRDIEVIFTTQFPQVLDVQVLLQVDLFVECELSYNDEGITFYLHDWWGHWTGKQYRKPWPPVRGQEDASYTFMGVKSMFGKYSTKQVIAPMFVDDSVREGIISREQQALGEGTIVMPDQEREDPATEAQAPSEPMVYNPEYFTAEALEDYLEQLPESFNLYRPSTVNAPTHIVSFAAHCIPELDTLAKFTDWLAATEHRGHTYRIEREGSNRRAVRVTK